MRRDFLRRRLVKNGILDAKSSGPKGCLSPWSSKSGYRLSGESSAATECPFCCVQQEAFTQFDGVAQFNTGVGSDLMLHFSQKLCADNPGSGSRHSLKPHRMRKTYRRC